MKYSFIYSLFYSASWAAVIGYLQNNPNLPFKVYNQSSFKYELHYWSDLFKAKVKFKQYKMNCY